MLLPEASLTGYVAEDGTFDLTRFAEPPDGPTATALATLARDHAAYVFGPLIEREGDHVYNACIGFDRAGREIARYRKRHPWFPEKWATPGAAAHPLVVIEGVPVTVAICFDVHFLEGALPAGARVLLFPSAWVEELDSRPEILAAVARRHDVTIVNANWGRGVPRVPGQGGSCIVQPDGAVQLELALGGRVDLEIHA